MLNRGWFVIAGAALALLFGAGMRSTFGVLIGPLDREFGSGRALLGTIAAIGLFLYGAVGPFVGRLADARRPRIVFACGIVLLGISSIVASQANGIVVVFLTLGVASAIASGAIGMPTATPLVARWFAERRGLVVGVLSAGMSAGQILLIPVASYVVIAYGWRTAMWVLGATALVVVLPLVVGLVRDGTLAAGTTKRVRPDGMATRDAVRTLPFWLLAGTFFVCGYTSTGLVLTHFIPDCVDRGFSPQTASWALAVMGGLNVVGTLGAGWVCDRFGRTVPLALFYLFRGITLIALIFVHEPIGLFLFAATFGLNYIATVPPTSALMTRIFGGRSAGELYGWIFVSHQVGAALGAWVGGVVYQTFGSYTFAYESAAALAFVSAIMAFTIRDEARFTRTPVVQPAGA